MGPELQQMLASQRLGQTGAPSPTSPQMSSMGGAPQAMPPSPTQPAMPTADPTLGTPGQPASTTSTGGLTPEAENQIILQALSTKLKSNSKIAEAKHVPPQPLT